MQIDHHAMQMNTQGRRLTCRPHVLHVAQALTRRKSGKRQFSLQPAMHGRYFETEALKMTAVTTEWSSNMKAVILASMDASTN